MLVLALFAPLIVAVPICWLARRWHWAWRVAAGLGFAAALMMIIQYTEEFYFAPSRTTPLEMPLALDRAGQVRTPVFRAAIGDEYEVNFVADAMSPRAFFCAAGASPNILTVTGCGNRGLELNLAWTAFEGGRPVASGASAFAEWNRIATAPTWAERDLLRHGRFSLPPDAGRQGPRAVQLGWMQAQAGHDYSLRVSLKQPAPSLAALHPRIQVTLTPMEYKNEGVANLLLMAEILFATLAIMMANAFRRPDESP